MLLLHLSTNPDFAPVDAETVSGYRGCWFYGMPPSPTRDELEERLQAWSGRAPSWWWAPDDICQVVQTFEPWEIGNRYRITEVFVAAEHLLQVQCIKAPLLAQEVA